MKITQVHVRRLFTHGDYQNTSFGYTADVEQGDSAESVKMSLLDRIQEDWVDFIGHKERLNELERLEREFHFERSDRMREIEKLEEKVEKMREFLKKHGVDTDDPSYTLPF